MTDKPENPSLIKEATKEVLVASTVELVCGFVNGVIIPKICRFFGEEPPLETMEKKKHD